MIYAWSFLLIFLRNSNIIELLIDKRRMLTEANAARAIKAVTNTPVDIPEGVEVIDVHKAIEEMMNESEERGERRMLVK